MVSRDDFDQPKNPLREVGKEAKPGQLLAKVGLISEDECRQIAQALEEIRLEIEQARFPFRAELEDVHMHVERALIERIGDTGRKKKRIQKTVGEGVHVAHIAKTPIVHATAKAITTCADLGALQDLIRQSCDAPD